MRMKTIYLSASLVAITALSACGKNLQEDLGLVKKAPDEFAVVTRAPLSVPPDYTLRQHQGPNVQWKFRPRMPLVNQYLVNRI
jgi:hypothetical protein